MTSGLSAEQRVRHGEFNNSVYSDTCTTSLAKRMKFDERLTPVRPGVVSAAHFSTIISALNSVHWRSPRCSSRFTGGWPACTLCTEGEKAWEPENSCQTFLFIFIFIPLYIHRAVAHVERLHDADAMGPPGPRQAPPRPLSLHTPSTDYVPDGLGLLHPILRASPG